MLVANELDVREAVAVHERAERRADLCFLARRDLARGIRRVRVLRFVLERRGQSVRGYQYGRDPIRGVPRLCT